MRAQISSFVVVGLILVLVSILILYVSFLSVDPVEQQRNQVLEYAFDLSAPQTYIESCVLQGVEQAVRDLKIKGDDIVYDGQTYAMIDFSQQEYVTLPFYESQLASSINASFATCYNETILENYGYTVFSSEYNVSVLIKDNIFVTLDFPIDLTLADATFSFSQFVIESDIPLGIALQAVRESINQELQTGSFDSLDYMQRQYDISIQKFKPYPNTLYNVTIDHYGFPFSFYYGMKGVDVFSYKPLDLTNQFMQKSNSCCYSARNICYANVAECDGILEEDCTCELEQKDLVEKEDCNGIPSGYSFCDSSTGVGSRSSVQYCDDGKIKTEYCRDFKQEVCEQVGNQAFCRPNTAQNCALCTDENCCTRSDCSFTQGVCSPKVPLGLPFWNVAYSQAICDMQCGGDCGNVKNYFESTQIAPEITSSRPLVPLTSTVSSQLSLTEQFTQSLRVLEDFAKYNSQVYLDPLQEIELSDTNSYCAVYQPSTNNVCSFCGTYGECSEYACKSLGSQCQFINNSCIHQVTTQQNGSVTSIDSQYQLELSTFHSTTGYVVTKPIKTQELFSVNFQTSSKSLCKPSYLPNTQYYEIQSVDLSNGQYATNHTLEIRFVNDLPVVDQLQSSFSVDSYALLIEQIVKFKFELDVLRSQYPFITRYTPPFLQSLNHFVDSYFENPQLMNELMSQLEQKQFYIFLSCQTQTGTQYNPAFISFQLANVCEAIPQLSFMQQSNNITIMPSVWSQCRFDQTNVSFAQMSQNMSCSAHAGDLRLGNYWCSAQIPQDSFVSCISHPSQYASIQNYTYTTYQDENATSIVYVDNTSIGLNQNATIYFTFDEPMQCTNLACEDTFCTTIANVNETIEFSCVSQSAVCEGLPKENSIYISKIKPVQIVDIEIKNQMLHIETSGDSVMCTVNNQEYNGSYKVAESMANELLQISCQNEINTITRDFFVEPILFE